MSLGSKVCGAFRGSGNPSLFQVHVDPRLRSAIGQCCRALRRFLAISCHVHCRCKVFIFKEWLTIFRECYSYAVSCQQQKCMMHFFCRLPQDDLLGDMVKSAQLSAESVRFFVTLMGARPKGLKDQVCLLS